MTVLPTLVATLRFSDADRIQLGVARYNVIAKGLIYAPEHRRIAFTVPQMADFINRQHAEQDVRGHRLQDQVLLSQPAAERQQVIPVGPHRCTRVVPVQQMTQVLIDQTEPRRHSAGQAPALTTFLEPQDGPGVHEQQV